MDDIFIRKCTELPFIGIKSGKKLLNLGLETGFDLLYYLPLRYENRNRLAAFNHLVPKQAVVFTGKIAQVASKRRYTKLYVRNQTGMGILIFFHHYFKPALIGKEVVGFGAPQIWNNELVFIHPDLKWRSFNKDLDLGLFPVYPLTKGVTQNFLRKVIAAALTALETEHVADHLPPSFLAKFALPELNTALRSLHFPDKLPTSLRQTPAYRRLIYEELLVETLIRKNGKINSKLSKENLFWDKTIEERFLGQLPFTLTDEQKRVINEIKDDLVHGKIEQRLLQGDVGCGKTVVAALSLRMIVANGKQGLLIAPTVLLAKQHFNNLTAWFPELKMVFLGGKLTLKARRLIYQQIEEGTIQLVVGTHAVLEDTVLFKKLGLVVIDEQHRFGVKQRLKIFQRNKGVYYLMMSATPIPRSLAMSLFGNLVFSQIREKPVNRQAIRTLLVSQKQIERLIDRVVKYCRNQGQVYWVCPLIESQDEYQLMSVEERFRVLAERTGLKIAILHGKMKDQQKEAVMQLFLDHQIEVLVATTVIEVGIDVKAANLMIIENPETLGLVQIHQLRGRVGRGEQEGYCVLLYGTKVSCEAKKRLNLLRSEQDGWQLAKQDLAWRGPGELFGYRQSGTNSFRFFDPWQDQALYEQLTKLKLTFLKKESKLLKRWLGKVAY